MSAGPNGKERMEKLAPGALQPGDAYTFCSVSPENMEAAKASGPRFRMTRLRRTHQPVDVYRITRVDEACMAIETIYLGPAVDGVKMLVAGDPE